MHIKSHTLTQRTSCLAVLITVSQLVQVTEVKADYVFEVQVDSYQNPTGKCLECRVNPSDPAGCCDDFPDVRCHNNPSDFCDTYLIFCLREFGTQGINNTVCPLGRHETPNMITDVGTELLEFQLGETALIGLPNPLAFNVSGDWPGRAQLLLVVMDRDPPFANNGGVDDHDADDVVDRYLIQENLTIGTEFTAPQQFNSAFTSVSLRLRVMCADGFEGMNCELLETDECSPNPCQRGSCIDLFLDYECQCLDGYEGRNCSNEVDECDPNPCQNGGTCEDLLADFSCSCAPGFTGRNCESEINECDPNPCQNGGTCEDLLADLNCSCVPGFTGRNCEDNIDDRVGTPCGENGQCEDSVGSFTCVCDPGHTGQLCDQTIAGGGSEQPEHTGETNKETNTAVASAVASAVGGVLVIGILTATVNVILCVLLKRHHNRVDTLTATTGPQSTDTIEPVYGVTSAQGQPHPPDDTENIKLHTNPVYGVSTAPLQDVATDQYYANEGMGPEQTLQYDYVPI